MIQRANPEQIPVPSNRFKKTQLDPPQSEELYRLEKRQHDLGTVGSMEVLQLYDQEVFPQGEKPYDGYQYGVAPPVSVPLIHLRGTVLLAIGAAYSLILSLILFVTGLYSVMGGDNVIDALIRSTVLEEGQMSPLAIGILFIAGGIVALLAAAFAWTYKRSVRHTRILVLFGVILLLSSSIWTLATWQNFHLGHVTILAFSLLYLLGALLNTRDKSRRRA